MKKEKIFFVAGLVYLLLITNNIYAVISHGSIKGNGLLLYDQGSTGGNTLNPVHTPTLDYKVVTVGTKTWAWIKSNGSTIDTGADWTSQLRYWSAANVKIENNMINRNAGSNVATETWTKTSATMPSPVRLSFFNVLMTGGWAETALIDYDPTVKNSLISGDLTVPVVTSCNAITYSNGAVTLSFSGSDNQGDLFYYITGTGIEEVSFGNNIQLSGLASNTVYTVTITPIDFSGNEGLPLTRTFKTMKSAGVSNISNNLGLNYNSTSTNVSGGEYVSIIQQAGNTLTLGLTSASDVITSGDWKNRVLVNPSVRVDGINYPLTLDGLSTTATITFTGSVGSKTIESGATLAIRWSVYNPGEFFTGTFTYTIGGADVEGPSIPGLSLVGNAINWSASTDAGSGVKGYEISEVGQPAITIMDLGETSFSYTLVNSAATVSVKALDFVNNKSDAASINNADNFRTKTSGNWNDLSNWEFSTNNADWSNASEIPATGAASVSILDNHLITVNDNTATSTIYVNPGAKLTINIGKTLTANSITLNSDATGTATFIDNGTATITSATVQQYLTASRNWYISSPIASGTAANLNLGTSVQTYSESAKTWSVLSSGNALEVGKGYVSVAGAGVGTTGTVNFSGSLNTGTITVPVTRTESGNSRGFNLVANPYPSYIDWSLVKADAANANIGTTMWFRTKTTGGAYTFSTYNSTGNESVANGAATSISKFIPPMQAFWVRVNANVGQTTYSTGITFKNTMRAHRDDNGNKFKAPKKDERKRMRLQVSNGTNTDETLLYFDAEASDNFDAFDSPKMFNNISSMPEIYTKVDNQQLVINGLNKIADKSQIALGYTTGIAGILKLKVTELNNFDASTKAYLIDNLENTETELTAATEYSFNSAITSNNENRFSLQFRAPDVTTDLVTNEKPNVQVFVNSANQIAITAPEKSNFAIYNAVGQLIEDGKITSNSQTSNIKLSAGVYLVKVNNQSTRVIIK